MTNKTFVETKQYVDLKNFVIIALSINIWGFVTEIPV